MALTEKVEDKLKEAEGILRDCLYWASKNEKPGTILSISKIINELDYLIKMDKINDKMEDILKKQGGDMFGGLF
jgi:hypothetical protein